MMDPSSSGAVVMVFFAYIIGSVNFSILVFRLLGKGDPRLSHSGNAGATNVYRQAGAFWALAVLVLDMARAMAVAWMACRFASSGWVPWVGFCLILGNRYPLFHGFRGGKGVANDLGFTAFIAPGAAFFGMLVWGLFWRLTGYPFMGSLAMVAVLACGVTAALGASPPVISGTLVTTLFIGFCHRRNIRDFLSGRR